MTFPCRRIAMLMGLAVGVLCLVIASPSRAADLTIPEGMSGSLSGLVQYDAVSIQGTLNVIAFDPQNQDTGWLHLRANRIEVGPNGRIDAVGAGFKGEDPPEGNVVGPGAGASPEQGMSTQPIPGGGGSNAGAGERGRTVGCNNFNGADGGIVVNDMGDPLALVSVPRSAMGSAGGRSYTGSSNPSGVWPGANGGGVIILEAAEIVVDGEVVANGGVLPALVLGAGPGGGAGGTVIIQSPNLTLGMGASLQARGSRGGSPTENASTSNGGPGGGGIVWVVAQPDLMVPPSSYDVSGADYADCNNRPPADDGRFMKVDFAGCVDLDGDGAESMVCGGDDCDDSRDDVYPGADETCDDVDNDCDGSLDVGAVCPAGSGLICSAGACVEDPNNPTGGAGAGPGDAPRIELGGGLCSAPASAATAPPSSHRAWLVLGLAAAVLWRRRRHISGA